MKTVTKLFYPPVAIGLAILLALPIEAAAAPRPQQQSPALPTTTANSNTSPNPAPSQNPAANDAEVASLPDSPVPVADSGGQNPPSPPQQQASQASPQQQTPQTMGTAAAPAEPANGVAASKPAGAAIAPARQKRTRTLVIKLSLLIGGAVAIGTVVALSEASPSRP